MDEMGFDETNIDHIIEVLKGLIKIIKEENEKKEKLCVECKRIWNAP